MSGERISPTAHYTGFVWVRHGLAPAAFATPEGRLLHAALRPATLTAAAFGAPSLDGYLLDRHRALDRLLEATMAEQGVSQVLELASGLAARGWRFRRRHGKGLRYLETDLPGMIARKRAALAHAGQTVPAGDLVALDVLAPGGLEELVGSLRREQGLAVVAEGLLSYLPRQGVLALWERLARLLGDFRAGAMICDLHTGAEDGILVGGFRRALGAFVRGEVMVHFRDRAEAEAALLAAGFASARVEPAGIRGASGPSGPGLVLCALAPAGDWSEPGPGSHRE